MNQMSILVLLNYLFRNLLFLYCSARGYSTLSLSDERSTYSKTFYPNAGDFDAGCNFKGRCSNLSLPDEC